MLTKHLGDGKTRGTKEKEQEMANDHNLNHFKVAGMFCTLDCDVRCYNDLDRKVWFGKGDDESTVTVEYYIPSPYWYITLKLGPYSYLAEGPSLNQAESRLRDRLDRRLDEHKSEEHFLKKGLNLLS